jgi:hypothetical protein
MVKALTHGQFNRAKSSAAEPPRRARPIGKTMARSGLTASNSASERSEPKIGYTRIPWFSNA